MDNLTYSFNDQATRFDSRAGLSDQAASQVAKAVLEYGQCKKGDCVLEIGAGTGEIGRWLCRNADQYIGIDSSDPMLDQFRARLSREQQANTYHAELICSDANDVWPVTDASARLIFGSRVLHLLQLEHVLHEVQRVGKSDGVTLIMGRVKRPKEAPKPMMRKKMRDLLEEYDLVPRATEQRRDNLMQRGAELGGILLEEKVAATWQVQHRPIDPILGWEGKQSMGGILPPPEIKKEILTQLRQWGAETFGELEQVITTNESYVLEGIRFKQGENT